MAIKITISDKVGFKVKGIFNDADGAEQEFEFTVIAKRFPEDEINQIQKDLMLETAKTGNHAGVTQCLSERIITNWGADVRDETDAPMPYTPSAFAQLCQSYKGLNVHIWQTYIANVGAKSKN